MFRIFSQEGFQLEFDGITVLVKFGEKSHCSNFNTHSYMRATPGHMMECVNAEVYVWRTKDRKSLIEYIWPRLFRTKCVYNSAGYVTIDMFVILIMHLKKYGYRYMKIGERKIGGNE